MKTRRRLITVILVVLVTQLSLASFPANLSAQMTSLDHQAFPFIYLNVDVVMPLGQVPPQLDQSSFLIEENHVIQKDHFEVVAPMIGKGIRVADIVFLMDNSGSMDDEQAAVRDHVLAFVDSLTAQNVDYRLGLCRFGSDENSGEPIIEDGGVLTEDVSYFKTSLWSRNSIGGSFEPGWDALYEAARRFNFRQGAQKILILITDETPTGDSNIGSFSQVQAIKLLNSNYITVFGLVNLSDSYSMQDYGTIAQATNGETYDVKQPLDGILDCIAKRVPSTYRIAYRTSIPAFDGTERHVVVTIKNDGQLARCDGTYVPGSAPRIARTQDTLELHSKAWASSSSLQIRAIVSDSMQPFTQSVTLWSRLVSTSKYESTSMTQSGDTWSAIIPLKSVCVPGVDYYISATDGQSTVTAPSSDPANHPYQLAVLPNIAPAISHIPISAVESGKDIEVATNVVDTTNQIASVRLSVRKTGQLIYQSPREMTSMDNRLFSATIPGSVVTDAGVEYYIVATDDFGISTYSGTADAPHVVVPISHQPMGFVRGRVTSDETALLAGTQGISGSTLRVDPDPLIYCPTTGRKGYFFFGIAPGEYTIRAEASGYIPESKVLSVSDGETVVANFALTSGRTPVLIVPGIMGSDLIDKTDSHNEPVWPFPVLYGKSTESLELPTSGKKSLTIDIVPSGPVGLGSSGGAEHRALHTPEDRVLSPLINPIIPVPFLLNPIIPVSVSSALLQDSIACFQDFMEQRTGYYHLYNTFIAAGYTAGKDLFTFPYDWRLSLLDTAKSLKSRVDEIIQLTKRQQINIVAHSMGGLVARAYINTASNPPISKLILMGTPSLGSPDAFLALHKELGRGMYLLSNKRAQELAANWPSVFQMLPTPEYFDLYGYIFDDEFGHAHEGPLVATSGEAAWRRTYLENPDSSLLDVNHDLLETTPYSAWEFHKLVGSTLKFSGDLYLIAGSGRSTLGIIRKKEQERPPAITGSAGLPPSCFSTWVGVPTNGDGTVPLLSVTRLESEGSTSIFHTTASHTGMLADAAVLDLVKAIVSNDTSAISGIVSKSQYLHQELVISDTREDEAFPLDSKELLPF